MEEKSPAPKKKPNFVQILASVAGFAVAYFAMQYLFSGKPNLDNAMMQAASEINKSCPIMVDSETRFDNCASMPNKVFQYNYTLIHYAKDSIDTEMLEGNLRPLLINSVKTSPSMKFQRDNKMTMSYFYKDKNGVFLFNIDVTPELYQQ